MKAPLSRSKRHSPTARFCGAILAAATVCGCASIPEGPIPTAFDYLESTHPVVVQIESDLVVSIESTNPAIMDSIAGDASGQLKRIFDRTEQVVASIDPTGQVDFRAVLVGNYPTAVFRLASFFTSAISTVRKERVWYQIDEGPAFTTIDRDILVVAPVPVDFAIPGTPEARHGVGVSDIASERSLLILEIIGGEIITDLLVAQGIAAEIVHQFKIERLLAEIRPAEDELELVAKIEAPGAMQARLMGAAFLFALRAAARDGSVDVDGEAVDIVIPMTNAELVGAIISLISSEEAD